MAYTYGLPLLYRPPECCACGRHRPSADGVAFDLWSFGVLSFYLLTSVDVIAMVNLRELKRYYNAEPKGNYWFKLVHPVMFAVLQPRRFQTLMNDAFLDAPLGDIIVDRASNFLRGLQRHSPGKRPRACQVLCHPFLAEDAGDGLLLEPDAVWNVEIPEEDALNCRLEKDRGDAGAEHLQPRPEKTPEEAEGCPALSESSKAVGDSVCGPSEYTRLHEMFHEVLFGNPRTLSRSESERALSTGKERVRLFLSETALLTAERSEKSVPTNADVGETLPSKDEAASEELEVLPSEREEDNFATEVKEGMTEVRDVISGGGVKLWFRRRFKAIRNFFKGGRRRRT